MAIVNTTAARPLPPAPRPAAAKADHAADERVDERLPSASARKSALLQMLDMQDDLSGLVSSMRRARDRSAGTDDIRSQAWIEHVLDEQGPQKVDQLRNQLRQLQQPDLATLRALMQTLFPEASDMLAVLRALLAEAELEAWHRELAKLHEELSGGDAGRAARGGVNVALKARLLGAQLQATPRQLRRSYQEFLAGEDPLETYQRWVDLYGFERRTRVLDFIEQALAADMYALDPSGSRLEFGPLLQSARQLGILRSADLLLLQHCWHPQLMARLGVQQHDLLAALLRMVRMGGGLGELFSGLLAAAGTVLSLDDRRCIVQGIRRYLKALPHGLWSSIGLQEQAMDEVEALLEQAVLRSTLATAGMHRVNA